jgi:sec-independent protein translocase protein TatA
MIGAPELLIVLVIVLVLFGGAKLPKLARSLGEAQREFKRGTDEDGHNSPTTTTPTSGTPSSNGATADRSASDPADKT